MASPETETFGQEHTVQSQNSTIAFDRDWIDALQRCAPQLRSESKSRYRRLLRVTRGLFDREQLSRLVPRSRAHAPEQPSTNGQEALSSPLALTEAIAHDFLVMGGKYARPFITLSAYNAMRFPSSENDAYADNHEIADAVKRVALSIEAFHKASLIHDDIEDGDAFRYGRPTLHQAYGLSTAINVGDYLIGLGYQLVSREAGNLGNDVVAEILGIFSDAHLRLSEGQGAELLWRDTRDKQLSPEDALEIYALKTSPAFEAALLSGMRCAGPLLGRQERLKRYCRLLGIAFQILNDLKDWYGDDDNKLAAGLDTLSGRPTLLWALALSRLPAGARDELVTLVTSEESPAARLRQVRALYERANVFAEARRLVDEYQGHALMIAHEMQPASLKRLLQHLLCVVLDAPEQPGFLAQAPVVK